MNSNKLYFPNLNGLRFIAASLVILTHIEQIKGYKGMKHFMNSYPMETGLLGVNIFFVLSGFLITYLLLYEEQKSKSINIKNFYIRRILRIWPLYYLIVILAMLILPSFQFFNWNGYSQEVIYQGFTLKLLLFLLFFPNLVHVLLGLVPYASQTWSVGAEEQFYLFWPWVFKIFKKNRVIVLLILIFIYFVFSFIIHKYELNYIPKILFVKAFFSTFNLDKMAIGGIFAILLFQKSKLLKIILNQIVFYISLIIVLVLWIRNIYIPYIHFQLYSVFFALIIVNFATNKNIKISLENKVLNHLGNISYGLYMYHPIAIILSIAIAKIFQITSNWFIYPLSFLFSILMADLSYRYFEKYFLKFKLKYSKVLSGNAINESTSSI